MPDQKVLLVDDEPLILRSMQKTLARAGYDVETAGDCNAGFATFEAARAAHAPFHLAVLDINMPGFDGVENSGAGLQLLKRLIEADPAFAVIMLSAYDEVNKAKEAVNSGAKGYCVKGREQSLLEEIKRILGD
jgi:YesN/AraC family two-component response regulator